MDPENLEREPRDEQYEESISSEDNDLVKQIHIPVARVKKIMKEGEHKGMISSDAPVVLAKACELLIRDLTLQSWTCTQMTKRCTLQRQDIISAIFRCSIYSFLLDILPPEDIKPLIHAPQVVHRQVPRDFPVTGRVPFNNVPTEFLYPKHRRVSRPMPYSHPFNTYAQSPQLLKPPFMRQAVMANHMGGVNHQAYNFTHHADPNEVPLPGSTAHSFSCTLIGEIRHIKTFSLAVKAYESITNGQKGTQKHLQRTRKYIKARSLAVKAYETRVCEQSIKVNVSHVAVEFVE
ncbi:nuclear transcription factor Y subunit C-2 [Theileria orientalis strain Shintoku]|uniref:Nuclear transcription factor Y subunit C-2 n=1 Tax=Theileria orientalis strain Shintoku TaxID=869250 RepID=J4C2Q3_THEOR|nr:nuclear transcription factor Y subunit C-2 [Theileria orientalis strain Shintoku]BAM39091.1 nuclear transcription factor Y subunit C-2 [Theileria orientalis strain Shintoku]|eukprot:XP_009689392.1 nuclear transcription factor Y subunit C-2 [Theileria orientalis strain Shintoku]